MSIPALILLPWISIILVATIGFFISLKQDRQLQLPRYYFLYCALAGSIQLTIRLLNSTQHLYWPFEFAHNVLLCFVSAELLSVLLSFGLTALIAIPSLAAVVFLTVNLVPASATTTTRLEISLKTIIIGGGLLGGVLFGRSNWTRERRLVFWGILLLMTLSGISSLVWFANRLGRGWTLFSQLAPLPGLICFVIAGRKKNSNSQSKIILRDGKLPI